MRIWFISDTHTRHGQLEIPDDIDVVIHCGDESNRRKTIGNAAEARDFFQWYCELKIDTKIFVPGNHSTAVEAGLIRAQDYPAIKFLIHEPWIWNGVHFFGSPYTPWFFSWAYNVARPDLEAIWASIPDDIDVLITHGPPKGILDVTRDWRTRNEIHVGSLSLARHVADRIKPRLHAFGHLHDEAGICNYGTLTIGDTQYINCACVNLAGQLVHHGQVIQLSVS